MVITLSSLLWDWLWAPAVMEVVWVFKWNCCLTRSYEALAMCHSPKLKVSISRLAPHLGCARELKISVETRSFRRGRVTVLACMCRVTPSVEILKVSLCWRPEILELFLREKLFSSVFPWRWVCKSPAPWNWRCSGAGGRLLHSAGTCCSATLGWHHAGVALPSWSGNSSAAKLETGTQTFTVYNSHSSILSCTVLASCSVRG